MLYQRLVWGNLPNSTCLDIVHSYILTDTSIYCFLQWSVSTNPLAGGVRRDHICTFCSQVFIHNYIFLPWLRFFCCVGETGGHGRRRQRDQQQQDGQGEVHRTKRKPLLKLSVDRYCASHSPYTWPVEFPVAILSILFLFIFGKRKWKDIICVRYYFRKIV